MIDGFSDDEDLKMTRQVLDELGMSAVSVTDLHHIRYICGVVSHRAACLVAAGAIFILFSFLYIT